MTEQIYEEIGEQAGKIESLMAQLDAAFRDLMALIHKSKEAVKT